MDRDQVARIRVIIKRRGVWANALYTGRRLPDDGLARVSVVPITGGQGRPA